MKSLATIVAVTMAIAAGPFATVASAQETSVTSANGFQPQRDYLALQPFEAIDTASGNVILTFADLVLPGNAGRELRFERVFNNMVMAPDEPQWRFSIGGVPLRVTHVDIPSDTQIFNTIEDNRRWGARLHMADGSVVRTTFMEDPNPAVPSTVRWVSTPDFWKYDRDTRHLYVPDGRKALYGADGRLLAIEDAFGNRIALEWAPGQLAVHQMLGADQVRHVLLEMDDATLLPHSLTYLGRTWQYSYEPDRPGKLTAVQPPLGRPWIYEYESPGLYSNVQAVTTPQGGRVTYTYDSFEFVVLQPAPEPPTYEYVRTLKSRTADSGSVTGTWTFTYKHGGGGALAGMDVALPSLRRVSFHYGVLSGDWMLGGTWSLGGRTLYAPDGTVAESEQLEYELLRAARPDREWYTPAVRRRVVTRGDRAHTTTYTYDDSIPSTFANYHQPTQIVEQGPTGELQRHTRRAYQHLTGVEPFMVGLVTADTVTIDSDTADRAWTYSAQGFRASETAFGRTTIFTPDERGNVKRITNPNGTWTEHTYRWGQPARTTTSEPDHAISRAINEDGSLQAETRGRWTTSRHYDALGRVERIDVPGAGNDTVVAYDDVAGTVTTTRGVEGGTRSQIVTTLDGFGRPIRTRDSAGVLTETDYDGEGRTIFRSLPFTGTTRVGMAIAYDAFGRTERESHAGTPWARSHRYAGTALTATDENGRETVLTRLAFGHPDDVRLSAVTDAAGQSWSYTYDVLGQLRTVSGPDAVTRTWTYEAGTSLLRSESHPESGTVTFDQYDASGNLRQKTHAKGQVTTYTYDGNNRLKTITAGASLTTIEYEPGTDDRKKVVVDGVSSEFTYDDEGHVASRTDTVDGKPFRVAFRYDGNDNVVEITYPSGRKVAYAYDVENRLSRVFNPDTQADYATTFGHHPSGAIETYTSGNGIRTTIGFDPYRYWTTSIVAGPLKLAYSNYDGVGNVGTLTDAHAGTQTFTYDALDRLSTASGAYGPITYAYDAHGNQQGANFGYDPANPFRLTRFSTMPMTYDLNGNLKTRSADEFTYTADNQLQVAQVGGQTTRYAYDGDAWRVKKAVDGGATTYYVRGPSGQLLMEWVNTSPVATVREYIYAGSRLIAIMKGDVPPR
jgi:YD repeat-containing protein